MSDRKYLPERMPDDDIEVLDLGLALQEGLSRQHRQRLAALILGGDAHVRAMSTVPAPPSSSAVELAFKLAKNDGTGG